MTNEESSVNAPNDAETTAQSDATQTNETESLADTTNTRDELWQSQFEPNAAREVGARHLGRLMYSSPEDWSRYVFHENDPKA